MARKKKASLRERALFWRSPKGRRRAGRTVNGVGLVKIAAVVCLLAGTGAFLRFAEGYVLSADGAVEGPVTLVDVPGWVNRDLKVRVAAVAGDSQFPLTDETASILARNLAPMAWLDDVRIQVTHDCVQIRAKWRKPVARIERGPSKFYVDADLVVLDHMPMSHLPIVEVTGVAMALAPSPGETFDQGDLAAAVELIELLHRIDGDMVPDNPLLDHIAGIDVSNYHGRRQSREPHIVFSTTDGTQIIWGAEIGEWAKHLEAKDEQKLAKLYAYYAEHGSLSAGARYINLRDPQDRVPLPTEKYRR